MRCFGCSMGECAACMSLRAALVSRADKCRSEIVLELAGDALRHSRLFRLLDEQASVIISIVTQRVLR